MIVFSVCSVCGRKRSGKVRGPRSTQDHIKNKHGGVGAVLTQKGHEEQVAGLDDESMASRHIQATLDEAMGIPNYDREWLI